MPAQLGNFVLETTTSPGTGTFTLNGPEADRRSFTQAFPSGGSVFYFADDGSQAEWGTGTLSPGSPATLARTKILGTTASTTAALNFGGTVEVYSEIPAERLAMLEDSGALLLPDVTDWTSQQVVNARSASARFVRGGANVSTDRAISQLLVSVGDASGRRLWAQDTDGSDYYPSITWANAVYATRQAITEADYAPKSWVNAQGYATNAGIAGANYATQGWVNGLGLITASGVAQSYVAKSDYANDFATGTASVIRTVGNKVIQMWSANVGPGTRVNYPIAMSSLGSQPIGVAYSANGAGSGSWVNCYAADNSGFTATAFGSDGSTRTLTITFLIMGVL
ncbi:hypothetical protein J2D73_17275 [Acetobacter sacchari]|uniref:Tail fiber protein n=1 Tax=Acetobacter sacchari TaxID=2661687 RepID=A0ABS3M053_9PROT|nr:hypothetical protein [Acetobacter sacchari]MBO1361540.1 hypothetical protein [Acetobacter sacchari]